MEQGGAPPYPSPPPPPPVAGPVQLGPHRPLPVPPAQERQYFEPFNVLKKVMKLVVDGTPRGTLLDLTVRTPPAASFSPLALFPQR